MEKIVFAEGWRKYFLQAGFESFEDFFNASGKQVNKNKKRDVQFFTLGKETAAQQTFFMKRFFKPYFKDMLFTFFNFGRICSQSKCEWNNANILLKNGIDTYRPVCYGERTILGIERESFFITKKLQGVCLTDFLAEKWNRMDDKAKNNLMAALGKFFSKIHNAAISMQDLYVWHIFLTEQIEVNNLPKYDFAVIDLHRMKNNVRNKGEYLENLGRFHHSMTDNYFDENNRKFLIRSYGGESSESDIQALINKVENLSMKVSAKRKPKPY